MDISWGLDWFDAWILGNSGILSIKTGRTIKNNQGVLRIQSDIQPKMCLISDKPFTTIDSSN